MLLFKISSLRITHFGINPDRGGKPPNDINTIKTVGVRRGNLFHKFDRERVVVFL